MLNLSTRYLIFDMPTTPAIRAIRPPRAPKPRDTARPPAYVLRYECLNPRATPPPPTRQANLLYVAITRAKRLLVLNPDLSNQLSLLGMWDSLSVKGSALDACLGLPGSCCTCGDAVPAAAEGVAGGTEVPLQDCIVYAGSMSKNPVCKTCVKGDGEEGERQSYFPYAAELLPQSI